jgi:hypothetical protein
MVQFILENLKKMKKMVKENIYIKMVHITMGIFLMIYLMEMENMFGMMEENIKELLKKVQ